MITDRISAMVIARRSGGSAGPTRASPMLIVQSVPRPEKNPRLGIAIALPLLLKAVNETLRPPPE